MQIIHKSDKTTIMNSNFRKMYWYEEYGKVHCSMQGKGSQRNVLIALRRPIGARGNALPPSWEKGRKGLVSI